MSAVPRRVLVIGLDGATLRLIEPWVRRGELPEIARLMATGCHGELRSTLPPLTPPAWSSFMTGKNPGKHGVFSFRTPAGDGYASGDIVTSRSLRARTLWDLVGETGRTVGAINVVPSYPVQPVNGFMVACMLAPSDESRIVHPPELRELLGDDYETAIKPPTQLLTSDPDYVERALAYLGALHRLAEVKLEASLRLMAARPCDLLTVVLYEPDRVQHFFWNQLLDEGTGTAGAEIRRAAAAVYRSVDTAVGRLVRAAGPDTATLLVSDHGFAAAPARLVSLNRFLADTGWLHSHRHWRWRRRLVRRLPARLRRRYDTTDHIYVDWHRSRAWCEVLETRTAGIWINVRGRQRSGCVAPGREYENARSALARTLGALAEDGRPVFELVARREDVYRGACTATAPDLLLYTTPRFGFRFDALRLEMRHPGAFSEYREQGLTGAHDRTGVYVAAGAGIATHGRMGPAPIEAVAPTVLCRLGLPVPDGMDAGPMLDLLTAEAAAALPVRYEPDREPSDHGDSGWQPDEQAQVEARLRALGYVE